MEQLLWYERKRSGIDNIPNKSGVYIIATKQKIDNRYAVNYVGQSITLKDRINEHFSENETNEELKKHLAKEYTTNIYFARVGNEKLNGIEKYLYQALEPKQNINDPPGESVIECNIPDVRPY